MRLTDAERSFLRKIGKKGGKARTKALSPARRREIARMGVEARLEKAAKKDDLAS